MEQQFQPEETNTPQTAYLPASQTSLATETEAETQTARLVTKRLNEITKRAKRAKTWNNSFQFAVIATFPLCKLTERLSRDLPDSLAMALELVVLLLLLVAMVGLLATFWLGLLRFDAEELAELGGLKAVGPLFAALQAPASKKQENAIRAALTLLLPQMKASDAPLLTPAHRQTIHEWLAIRSVEIGIKTHHNDLRVAALKALEQVGDATAIPVVERLANRKPRTPSQMWVKQAAMECLPMLRAHCGEVEAARTLLRASQAGEVRPDTLLRPASGAGQANPAELLRGANPPDVNEDSGE